MAHRFQEIGSAARAWRMQPPFFALIAGNLLVFLAALLFGTVPASALGPRDEAIAGMFRCAAVGDTRVWLDCFYGAAQPMRAALGLPPVLAAQARLAQNPPASNQSGDLGLRYQVTTDVLRCNSLGQDRQWLDCYYATAQPIRAQLGLPTAPQVLPPLPAQTAGKPFIGQDVGRETAAVGFPITSRMASYSFDRYGMFTVVLTNGLAWRQLSGDTSVAHWTKPAPSYTVQISRGALSSFNLKVKGISSEYKVERMNGPG